MELRLIPIDRLFNVVVPLGLILGGLGAVVFAIAAIKKVIGFTPEMYPKALQFSVILAECWAILSLILPLWLTDAPVKPKIGITFATLCFMAFVWGLLKLRLRLDRTMERGTDPPKNGSREDDPKSV